MRRPLSFACVLATVGALGASAAPASALPPRGSVIFTVGALNGLFDMHVEVQAVRSINLPAGTLLASGVDGDQRVMTNETLKLVPGQTASVQVFCIDPARTMAQTGTHLHAIGPARGEIAAIFAAAGTATPEVLQRAIWVARGDPRWAVGQPEVAALLARARVRSRRGHTVQVAID